jgi:ATPase family associated with various cellular activities (AAA)
MDKLARLLVNRLRHLASREARRTALRNGLLEAKVIDVAGHLMCRYTPAFDTTRLSGDPALDAAWFKRNFGAMFVASEQESIAKADVGANSAVALGRVDAQVVAFARLRGTGGAQGTTLDNGSDRRAYAVALVDRVAPAPLVSHVLAALVMARAVRNSARSLRDVVHTLTRVTPTVTFHAPIDGFERQTLRLLEKSGLVPGGPFAIINSDDLFDDNHFDANEGETRKPLLTFPGAGVHRVRGNALRRRMLSALSHEHSILAIAEKSSDIPALLHMCADLSLEATELDRSVVADLVEVLYPDTEIETLGLPSDAEARWLSLEDLDLAFRPGRQIGDGLHVLAALIEHNRAAVKDDGESNGEDASGSKPSATSAGKASGSDDKQKSSESGGGWNKDKPSGAEVIQPEPAVEVDEIRSRSPVVIEALSGYGKAKDWALDLKADLDDYRATILTWSELSTKLLLSGPPGTGKTTFARALCNSLQVPLVVTSVSTWLQGSHLNNVIDKMSKTFVEARAMAPAILFIDEIDGIGKRQPAEREYSDYWNAVVNKLLELLDGAVKNEGLIIVGATNHPSNIDDAIRRSGRLETHIEIARPDVPALAKILAYHLGDDAASLVDADQASRTSDADDGFSLKKIVADHLAEEAASEHKEAGR